MHDLRRETVRHAMAPPPPFLNVEVAPLRPEAPPPAPLQISTMTKVAFAPAVLAITISVTTVVVAEGTVYRVVLDVDAAPLKRIFEVVAISYYLS